MLINRGVLVRAVSVWNSQIAVFGYISFNNRNVVEHYGQTLEKYHWKEVEKITLMENNDEYELFNSDYLDDASSADINLKSKQIQIIKFILITKH